MTVSNKVASNGPHPFAFHLEQAAKSDGINSRLDMPRPLGMLRRLAGTLRCSWSWYLSTRAAQTATRRLRVTETVSLGEKRFLSIVQVDKAQFLIGTSATSVQLLANLGSQPCETARTVETQEAI